MTMRALWALVAFGMVLVPVVWVTTPMAMPMPSGAISCEHCGDAGRAMTGDICVAPFSGVVFPSQAGLVLPALDCDAGTNASVETLDSGRTIAPEPSPPKLSA
jgi:hypothetical protein